MPRVVAVLGTGSIGRRYLQLLSELPDVRSVAVPVRPGRSAELRAEGFQAVASLDELARQGVHAGIVATATRRHARDAAALMAFGDVLVEKPAAAELPQLGAVRAAAQRGGRNVWVGYCLRFHEGLRRFRALLPMLGRIDTVRIACQSYLPDWRPGADYRESYAASPEDGGVLRDLSHELDYAAWLFGRPSSVYPTLGRSGRLEIALEDSADLLWTTPGGATVSIRLDYLLRPTRRHMIAAGESGELEWDAIGGWVELRQPGCAPQRTAVLPHRDAMMRAEIAAFLEASRGGSAGDLATLDEGAFVLAVCDAARRSGASGRPEAVQPWSAG